MFVLPEVATEGMKWTVLLVLLGLAVLAAVLFVLVGWRSSVVLTPGEKKLVDQLEREERGMIPGTGQRHISRPIRVSQERLLALLDKLRA
jgi:hypothetical protein